MSTSNELTTLHDLRDAPEQTLIDYLKQHDIHAKPGADVNVLRRIAIKCHYLWGRLRIRENKP